MVSGLTSFSFTPLLPIQQTTATQIARRRTMPPNAAKKMYSNLALRDVPSVESIALISIVLVLGFPVTDTDEELCTWRVVVGWTELTVVVVALTDIVELTVPAEKDTVFVKETDHAVDDWLALSDFDKLAVPEETPPDELDTVWKKTMRNSRCKNTILLRIIAFNTLFE